ncbi:MAG: glutamyl-tRNA reductase [Chloroflexi bacterium]|nr:glutamyl-tRNA reductase [Chloroflexota bacterium]
MVGINHSTAPITVREKAAITAEQLNDSLSLLRRYVPCGLIVSTCNRTEVYVTDSDGRRAEEASIDFLKALLAMSDTDLRQHIYSYKDKAAVEHLFRVTSGLDSMIIGEFEIVREETGISKNALSVSSVAVDLAAGIVDNLKSCRMLVIGAGEAGRLVAKVAKERGTSRIVVANRTQEAASVLMAALGGVSVTLDNLVDELSRAQIAVTCTGASHWILDVGQVRAAMRQRSEQPLVIIDIGVPRNVEPAVSQINNVFLYNIDDLTEISNRNRQQREGEIRLAMEIIAAEADRFINWWRTLEVRPVVSALMKKAEDIRCRQLQRTLDRLPSLSAEERDNLEAMTKSIVTRILKDPINHLKTNAGNGNGYTEIISELFQLDTEETD